MGENGADPKSSQTIPKQYLKLFSVDVGKSTKTKYCPPGCIVDPWVYKTVLEGCRPDSGECETVLEITSEMQ